MIPTADNRGNRVWVVPTRSGPVIQKFYRPRRPPLWDLTRRLGTSLRPKSDPGPRGRRETERRVLAAWSTAGFDVPADVTDQHAAIAGPDVLVLEFVSGPTLHAVLRGDLGREARDALLSRFAGDWGQRHAHALRLQDPVFLQEHGNFRHVLVQGARLVTFDHEQVYLPGSPVLPLVLKEVIGYLRSIQGVRRGREFEADLVALVRGYDDPQRLIDAADVVLRPGPLPRLGQILLGLLDRNGRSRRKLRLARTLRDQAQAEIEARAAAGRDGGDPATPAEAAEALEAAELAGLGAVAPGAVA